MNWTARDDRRRRCALGPGGVGDAESVARITIRQVPQTGYTPFRRADLTRPTGRPVSDDCGKSDGLSVDRCSALPDAALVARSAARAAAANARRIALGKFANQFPLGAKIAGVERLRGLTVRGVEAQAVFVYDDPVAAGENVERNDEHAVIRIGYLVEEERVARLIDAIVSCFDREVS